eukprot:scaffold3411_cov396-Prasinococcus_capsulatus_cf.AAC.6
MDGRTGAAAAREECPFSHPRAAAACSAACQPGRPTNCPARARASPAGGHAHVLPCPALPCPVLAR